MKWIKSRKNFLAEAAGDPIRQSLKPKQIERVKSTWGERFLDYKEIEPNDDIKAIQGTWKLTPEQKYKMLDLFFITDVRKAEATFENLPTEFKRAVSDALNHSINEIGLSYDNKMEELMADGIDFDNIGLEEISEFTENVMPRIDVKTTVSDRRMVKDENRVPVKDEEGNLQFAQKEVGEFAYYSGLYNLNSFAADYDDCMRKLGREDQVVNRNFSSNEISAIKNIMSTTVKGGHNADLKVFHKDAYVSIEHNPQDILNISVSKFYASCQELYGGSHVRSLLANVFDPASVPAFVYLDSPVYRDGEVIADKLPLARFMIRSILVPEDFDNPEQKSKKLFFDRVYPQRMSQGENSGVYKLVEDVARIRRSFDSTDEEVRNATYVFAPDISSSDSLSEPYQDTLTTVETKRTIGLNCRYLNITANSDWSDVIVRKNNQIEQMVINTPKVPANLFDLEYNLKNLKIVNIDIKEMPYLAKFGTGDITFEDCRTNGEDLRKGLQNVALKSLTLNRCQIAGLNLDGLDVDELVLKTSVDSYEQKLEDVIGNSRIKRLTVSDDLTQDPENVEFLKAAVARKQIGQWTKVGLLSRKLQKKK